MFGSFLVPFAACTLLQLGLSAATPVRRQAVTALGVAQITAFTPYTYYASAAYCSASATRNWTCGANCAANPQFKPVASGGDGDFVQFWYVGYDPTLQTVIVGHQGTNPEELVPLLTDSNIFMGPLSQDLFPGVDKGAWVHSGFRDEQAKTASQVLSAVQTALTTYSANHVTLVGHSLGAALSLLDAVYLPLHIPDATFKTVVYGLPRVGNQAFADYVDVHVGSLNHVNNKHDPVPILPGQFLGYHHPSGEVHIDETNAWMACAGQDNPNSECEVGAVPTIFEGNLGDHDGPYDGVIMGMGC